MIDLDKWKEIYSTLVRNKLRTAVTAFGVAWGIMMLIIMLGAGVGLENGVKREFFGIATNRVFIWGRHTTLPYNGFKKGRRIQYTNNDTDALSSNIPEIEYLSPGSQLGGWRGANNVRFGNKIGAFNINGFLPVAKKVYLFKIPHGRFINDRDIDEKRKVAIIGQRVWEVLFDEGEAIGQYIEVQGVYFKVVGIFQSSRSGDHANEENQAVYIPLSTLQQAFNRGIKVGYYAIIAKTNTPASLVEEKAKRILAKRHNVHPDDMRAIGSFNAEKDFQKSQRIFIGVRYLSWFVGVFTLLAGIIGISNIMLIIIKERTKEIGIRRAIGARPIDIMSQIILEAFTLTASAGMLGFMIGIFIVEQMGKLIEASAFANPGVDIQVALIALFILIISGILAGILPAYRAIKIRPIEALHLE